MFFLLYRHPDVPKISKDARRFLKIAKDFQGRPEYVSIIHQRIKEQFKRQTLKQCNHRYPH